MRLLGLLLFAMLSASLEAGNIAAQPPNAQTWSIEDEVTIQRALAQIESGHCKFPDVVRGASGEVSRFQIMPNIWKKYTRSNNFTNPGVAWSVAYKILKNRYSQFVRATGRQPTAFDLYAMWNKPGLYAEVDFAPHRLPTRLRDVARRFENLVLALQTGKSKTVLSAKS